MRSFSVMNLLAFVAWAQVEDLMVNHRVGAQATNDELVDKLVDKTMMIREKKDSADKLVDKLADKLISKLVSKLVANLFVLTLRATPTQQQDLDSTTLWNGYQPKFRREAKPNHQMQVTRARRKPFEGEGLGLAKGPQTIPEESQKSSGAPGILATSQVDVRKDKVRIMPTGTYFPRKKENWDTMMNEANQTLKEMNSAELSLEAWEDQWLQEKLEANNPKPKESGFLSFSRLDDLNDLNQDLSETLKKKEVEVTDETDSTDQERFPKALPGRTRPRQAEKFKRSSRYSSAGELSGKSYPTYKKSDKSVDEFSQTKDELILETLLAGLLGTGLAFGNFGKGAGVSFAVGAVACLFYFQALALQVGSIAPKDEEQAIGGAAGGLRLVIPALLAAIFSKYHKLVETQYGLDLNVIGLLAGFYVPKELAQLTELTKAVLVDEKKPK